MMHVTPAPRVDWNAVLLALRREGYTLHDVAAFTGIPRSTLTSWQAGSNPGHQDGETLVRFWSEALQLPREALPEAPVTAGARLYASRGR